MAIHSRMRQSDHHLYLLLFLLLLPLHGSGFLSNNHLQSRAKRQLVDTPCICRGSSDGGGLVALRETVVLLGRDPSTDGGCHWVDEQDVASVTRLLQGELEEVEEALQAVQEGSASAAAGRALLSECGDVLWNAMLLCHVAGRAVRESSSGEERSGSGSAIESAAAMASEKIRRRTPYIAEWGPAGSGSVSRVDAEAAWNAAKAAEGGNSGA